MRSFLSYLIPLLFLVFDVFASDYHEQLNLKPLPQSSLLASFNFRSNTTLTQFAAHNFRYFPRSLGQILQHVGTRELHLRFSLGRWDAESWGARPWDGTKEGGTGVELWAWLEADTEEEADHKWLTLTNALSGLFCASLNFIDETRTTRPVMSFRPEGDHGPAIDRMHLLHGVLPHEIVCTENLTPFLKLLPCKGKAGISSLLDGHKLFDATWQSMAIDIRPLCPPGQECVLQIEQTIDMVLDIERSKRPRAGEEWSLDQLFGKYLKGTCPLTDPDVPPVCIQVPERRDIFSTGGAVEIKNPNGLSRCYQISPERDFSMILPRMPRDGDNPKTTADEHVQPGTPLLYAERSFTGHGQERGGVQSILTNPSPDTEVEFVYMESLPWFMRVYLHTLKARVEGTSGAKDDLIEEIYYRPALDRARGTQLELRMRVPPASTVFLTYDFEKSVLRYTEYPPDANRGFDVAASIITILPSTSPNAPPTLQKTSNLRTTSLLLSLPTPDFSMPYNVIIFTSTAIALAFGGLYNILVRRFVGADEGPEEVGGLRGKIALLVAKLKSVTKGKVD
ncbi:hypothetical protein FHL15_003521 [Xylaria flabelliformis]|uniref:GPI transamidase component GPI16 n=1 Tax=Xylaria flabelliformis TaxID=2512241 RepID=A0A553I5T6_9PEZI|nr:hypothetical protein FHL15_003521 [Xylaria flabelliformis]